MIPSDCVPTTGKMVMEVESGPDEQGRCQFFMYWHGLTGPRHDTPGVKGQVFFARPGEHMQNVERVVDRRPEVQRAAHPLNAFNF